MSIYEGKKELPPFDAGAKCPACGGRKVSAIYRFGGHAHSSRAHGYGDHDEARIERSCLRCGYEWDEKPLNSFTTAATTATAATEDTESTENGETRCCPL